MTDKPIVWPRPIVWAFCNGITPPFGDQHWVAVTDDGLVVAQQVSSNASWGAHDVGPDRKRQAYIDAFGCADVDYRALALNEQPPAYVIERAKARAECQDAAVSEENR